MTFAQWQEKYPKIPIVYPHAEAPEVALISGRDPLINGGGTTWDPPMFALFTLEDYHVTSSNVHRGTVWLAPKVTRDDWTRTDYMCSRVSHEEYYQSLARLIGWQVIAGIVLRTIGDRAYLRRHLDSDQHLNGIPLAYWDALHDRVRRLVSEQNRSKSIMARSWCGQPLPPHTICWSQSESVCVLKAVARALALESEASPDV